MKYILISILVVFVLMAVMSCNSEKHVAKTYTNKDSLALVEAKKVIFTITSERDEYKRKYEELEHLGVTFKEDDHINLDSLKKILIDANCPAAEIDKLVQKFNEAQTTIRKLTDGTLEIKGRISSLTQSKRILEEQISTKEKRIQQLENELKQSKTQVKAETKEVIVEKERSYIPVFMWILLVISGVIGFLIKGWAKNFSIKDL